MKKLIMLALALSLFVGVHPAKADDSFSMTEMTCEELLSDEEGLPYALFWMAGYLGAKTDDVVMSGAAIEQFTEQVVNMCTERPEATIGDMLNYFLQ